MSKESTKEEPPTPLSSTTKKSDRRKILASKSSSQHKLRKIGVYFDPKNADPLSSRLVHRFMFAGKFSRGTHWDYSYLTQSSMSSDSSFHILLYILSLSLFPILSSYTCFASSLTSRSFRAQSFLVRYFLILWRKVQSYLVVF